jgi:hypothetical protein
LGIGQLEEALKRLKQQADQSLSASATTPNGQTATTYLN